ncbi:DNA-binding protein [candidate division KSB1 bacterium]|nr:DNA-binding protein [candidate division KSB1 bacterium]NIR69827.1 DNA-binding protein [candidate division KSB1 bacterium]NIS24374.1 DNA-binding protein [candidate division KSB1 bacterium]NIT71310.1 DNA-binding protein [candidate division KSB1 bacterium]NIU27605.1 DNA-binding protein [candidate division KSB1 bacterium]
MEQLTITLSEEIAKQLRDASEKIGVKPEELLLVSLQEKLAKLDSDFTDAMQYVLKKNAELYKRLS